MTLPDWWLSSVAMTIELAEDELLEIVKALEAIRRLHMMNQLPTENLSRLIDQLKLNLPGSGVRLRPKLPDSPASPTM